MITVSLVTLTLILNAVATAVVLLYVRREVRLTLNALTHKMRTERKTMAETVKRQDSELFEIRDAVKQGIALMTPDKQKGLLLGASFRDKMEDRYVADLTKERQITVNGIPASPNGHTN